MASKTKYSTLQIGLHWLIALLILAAWLLSDGMGQALRARVESGATGIQGNTIHVWLGGATFLLVLIRIVVRLIQGAPDPVPGSSELIEKAGVWGHRLLYALMVLTPALGAATWYGGIGFTAELHDISSSALMLVALGHAAMAIYHQFILKDGTLTRMRPH
jgi:cytochrome b561